ncbi:U-box domain-containing protein 17-like [Iris pallida]|uniref:U-box domain-containing protein 17-like n=1 Tax=Iris pallida TaxID=29817 RepID=A0AAX6EHT3_IRIPA|nr:U-box domain-containing protein 17-like [Iris pallida]
MRLRAVSVEQPQQRLRLPPRPRRARRGKALQRRHAPRIHQQPPSHLLPSVPAQPQQHRYRALLPLRRPEPHQVHQYWHHRPALPHLLHPLPAPAQQRQHRHRLVRYPRLLVHQQLHEHPHRPRRHDPPLVATVRRQARQRRRRVPLPHRGPLPQQTHQRLHRPRPPPYRHLVLVHHRQAVDRRRRVLPGLHRRSAPHHPYDRVDRPCRHDQDLVVVEDREVQQRRHRVLLRPRIAGA